MVALGSINGWHPADGPVTTWMASPAAREAARSARRDGLAPSFQRARHLWAAYDGKAADTQLPRLVVVAWEIPGVCDIPAMTATINAHVRHHDAYHDWFEFDNDAFVRRTIDDPEVIDFVPTEFGHMNTEQIRAHALTTTPKTLERDCFTFGIAKARSAGHAQFPAWMAGKPVRRARHQFARQVAWRRRLRRWASCRWRAKLPLQARWRRRLHPPSRSWVRPLSRPSTTPVG